MYLWTGVSNHLYTYVHKYSIQTSVWVYKYTNGAIMKQNPMTITKKTW